ncbi:Hypothetical predicted protein [Lecanosticta acicola]|uniref:Uncharacterized protein n=1 Tax=Lecanosticta acicola TaxID=111012 RepID=A0AAI8Z1T4_9PEZI|nr:Hypothetical predicted protein [Lecanosticta acicola]
MDSISAQAALIKEKPLPEISVETSDSDMMKEDINFARSKRRQKTRGGDLPDSSKALKDAQDLYDEEHQIGLGSSGLVGRESYSSSQDWPLQTKARPWLPMSTQTQHATDLITIPTIVAGKASSDTLGSKSLRGLGELYDSYQPAEGGWQVDVESLRDVESLSDVEEKYGVQERNDTDLSTWQKASRWFRFGKKGKVKDSYEKVSLMPASGYGSEDSASLSDGCSRCQRCPS